MFIVFSTWKCGFGCKYCALIWAFLHMRTLISPTHSPLTLFHWKGLGRSILNLFLTSYSFPTLSGCWLCLGIFLDGNGDKLLASTTQNPWSILSTMWHDFRDYDVLRFYHSLQLLLMFGHVQLHQLSLYKSITTFFRKFCQPCVNSAWSIVIFPLEIFDLLHLIFTNALIP